MNKRKEERVPDHLYSIGQASKLCDVSSRMLRYYEEIGLIQPDYVSPESRYRYYAISTLRDVQTVRYLVTQGFSLEEIKASLFDDDLDKMQEFFLRKIDEAEADLRAQKRRLDSLKDWCGLVFEGKEALRHNCFMPSIRYFPSQLHFCYERSRAKDEVDSDIILATEYFSASKRDGHAMIDVGGAFTMHYASMLERMDGTYTSHKILQTIYEDRASEENTQMFGGFNGLCAYHIGADTMLPETYRKLQQWAEAHHFALRGDSVERHVIDIYSLRDENRFVTEVIFPLEEDTETMAITETW